MPFLKRYRLFILFFSVIAVAGAAFSIDIQNTPKSNADACGIYKAYHANLEKGVPHVFRPISTPMQFDPLDEKFKLPDLFFRDTGIREIIDIEFSAEPFEKTIYEEFAIDSAQIFEKPILTSSERIGSCFSKANDAPAISRLPTKMIEILKFGGPPGMTEDGFAPAFNSNFLTIHQVSSPLFSTDKRYGLIIAESYCGSLCGHGGYFLFEKIDGDWQQIGFKTLWVS